MITIYANLTDALAEQNAIASIQYPISAVVDEGLNEELSCRFQLPIGPDSAWEEVVVGRVVEVDGILFDIRKRVRARTSNELVVTADCEHVSYRLLEKDYPDDVYESKLTEEALETATTLTVDALETGQLSVGDVLQIGRGDTLEYKQVADFDTNTNTITLATGLFYNQPVNSRVVHTFLFADKTPAQMLAELVSGTDLQAGTAPTAPTETFVLDGQTAREALKEVVDRFELDIEYDADTINLVAFRGQDPGITITAGVQIGSLEDVVDDRDDGVNGVSGRVDVAELEQLADFGAAYRFEVGDKVTIVDAALQINQVLRIVFKQRDVVFPMLSNVELASRVKRLETAFSFERTLILNEAKKQADEVQQEQADEDWQQIIDITSGFQQDISDIDSRVTDLESGGSGVGALFVRAQENMTANNTLYDVRRVDRGGATGDRFQVYRQPGVTVIVGQVGFISVDLNGDWMFSLSANNIEQRQGDDPPVAEQQTGRIWHRIDLEGPEE